MTSTERPGADAAPSLDIEEIKARLNAELDELAKLSEVSMSSRDPVELDQQSVGRLARADAMRVQAMAFASESRRVAEARRITAALARIEQGEFGACVSCGEEISEARLRLDPTIATCVECAESDTRSR